MPITKELKNVRNFESVGFSHEQAETLADVIEESHVDSHENLKEFIRNEFEKQAKDFDSKLFAIENKLSNQTNSLDSKLSNQISSLDSKLSKQISSLEVSLMASQKDLLIKLFGIIVGTAGMAVTILKLF